LLNIRLLCEYKKEEVIAYARKSYYPQSACLDICKKYNVHPAIAFLLKRTGAYSESLDMYIQIMWEVCDKLLDPTKREYIELNVEDYNKYFNCAIKVCDKHATITSGIEAEQGQWFIVLQHLYEFYLKLMKSKETPSSPVKQTTRNSPLDLIGTTINNCIRKLLSAMMEHISFQKILSTITEKHGELEMENFKAIFSTMILSYIHQEKILDSARQILQHRIVTLFEDLEKDSRKGRGIKTNVCARCKKHFVIQAEKEFFSFPCGHIYHTTCLKASTSCEECMFNNKRIESLINNRN
jgi:hypothetical protein